MLPIITTDSGFSTCFPYFLTSKIITLNKKARHFAAPDLTVRMKTDLMEKNAKVSLAYVYR